MPEAASPVILGVRHHSPACARLVADRIRALRPRHVLIEGPADFNERLAELSLPHRLPLAVYSYFSAGTGPEERRCASWSPFAVYSPEWQALTVAREVGAQPWFIDLPAWHEAFADTLNRYADTDDEEHDARAAAYEAGLARALAVEGRDALWDHLFEDELTSEALSARLTAYFESLRGEDTGSPGNRAREAMMARWIAWAMARREGPVLVVCGGYHAPALARAWPMVPVSGFRAGADGLQPPDTPVPDDVAPRYGSYLVPYSFKRLDAFTGYASGMPSPAYHQWVWEGGPAQAGRDLLRRVLERLRGKRFPASTADVMAVQTHADALARLRGHAAVLRCDWLDALAGTLIKEALDAPLPWSYRGPIRPGTAPVLVEVMDVLAGDVTGRLAPGTPQPPLVSAVEAELAAQGIVLSGERRLDLWQPEDRVRSRLLHRLAVLAIPGIHRRDGPDLALAGDRHETWTLFEPLEQRAALIEAAGYGATLPDAARARLEEDLRRTPPGPGRMAAVAAGINRAAFAGLAGVSERLLAELQAAVAGEPHFESFGGALSVLHSLYRHGAALDMAGAPLLRVVIAAAVDRALWLLEANGGVPAANLHAHVRTFLALRQVVRDTQADPVSDAPDPLPVEPARVIAVLQRKAAHPGAAPVSRGAALGAVLSLSAGHRTDIDAEVAQALALLGRLPPAAIGDALTGLVALARDELTHEPVFVQGLDTLVQAFGDEDFVQALPAMRAAFAWLPVQERGGLAQAVLRLHPGSSLSARQLTAPLAQEFSPEQQARAAALEAAALRKLTDWGVTL